MTYCVLLLPISVVQGFHGDIVVIVVLWHYDVVLL